MLLPGPLTASPAEPRVLVKQRDGATRPSPAAGTPSGGRAFSGRFKEVLRRMENLVDSSVFIAFIEASTKRGRRVPCKPGARWKGRGRLSPC